MLLSLNTRNVLIYSIYSPLLEAIGARPYFALACGDLILKWTPRRRS